MSDEKKEKQQKFSKEAYLKAAESTKERLIVQIVLKEGASYSKTEAEKLVKEWKQKEVR